jgi:hypothetical protein
VRTTSLCILLSFHVLAQVDTSVIGGTVRDERMFPIAGANVTIRNVGTNFALQLETNERGIYISPPLRIGRYEITAEKPGLQKTTPAPFTFGNAGRNILLGPPTTQLDVSLFKDIALRPEGKLRAQFRAESFNITNTPQLNNPSNVIGTADAGTISNAGSPGSFARTQRQLQFALRILF